MMATYACYAKVINSNPVDSSKFQVDVVYHIADIGTNLLMNTMQSGTTRGYLLVVVSLPMTNGQIMTAVKTQVQASEIRTPFLSFIWIP